MDDQFLLDIFKKLLLNQLTLQEHVAALHAILREKAVCSPDEFRSALQHMKDLNQERRRQLEKVPTLDPEVLAAILRAFEGPIQ